MAHCANAFWQCPVHRLPDTPHGRQRIGRAQIVRGGDGRTGSVGTEKVGGGQWVDIVARIWYIIVGYEGIVNNRLWQLEPSGEELIDTLVSICPDPRRYKSETCSSQSKHCFPVHSP